MVASRTTGVRTRGRNLIEAVRTHLGLVVQREGRQAEFISYEASVDRLRRALNALGEAEFDWCGSFPVPAVDVDDELPDEPDEPGDGLGNPSGAMLTVMGRWDFRVVGAAAVIEAGRVAYARMWPNDTAEDAELAVPDVSRAANEILHAEESPGLLTAPGLDLHRDALWFAEQETSDDQEWERDPFAIMR